MHKSHPPYPAEFKRRLVELVRAGRNSEVGRRGQMRHRKRIPLTHTLPEQVAKITPGADRKPANFLRAGDQGRTGDLVLRNRFGRASKTRAVTAISGTYVRGASPRMVSIYPTYG